MGRFPKPSEGSWTEHHPGLGTAPISYDDSCSAEFYELERAAIFRRSWLQVGRVEQLPRGGSYFTREIAVAGTSIVVVRDLNGEVRAFHNVCRHRGNKLVWTDFPREETSGAARQFVCKYHGWRYDLDGACAFVQQEREFFDLDKSRYGLVPVHCAVWAGFVFVNFDETPRQPLREFLGPMVGALEDYPFDRLTERYGFRAVVPANWKIFMDALQEQYHAPIVHRSQRPEKFEDAMQHGGFEALHYQLDGPHRMFSSPGIQPWQLPDDQIKPSERLLRSGLFGAWDDSEVQPLTAAVSATRPGGHASVGVSLFEIWPNFGIQFWQRGWYHTYHHWPLSHDAQVFECNLYFAPARNARERVAHEMTAVTFKEFALQDDALVASIQSTLAAGVLTSCPLGDQEILVRHLHKTARDQVAAYQRERGGAR
jgi:phenylpropionate dioxygenase-like ring-hydroxylating dioxygenase large terminal subunit